MKTKYFILAAMTSIALASCSSDEYVGDTSPTNTSQEAANDGSIQFGSGFRAITRANSTGGDAATLLNNEMKVYGVKQNRTTTTNYDKVFVNYSVKYNTDQVGNAEYNDGWYYVGAETGQTIKYWDYASANYHFVAGSPVANFTYELNGTTGEINTATITGLGGRLDNSTTVASTQAAVYIANPEIVEKANYNSEVLFTFKAMQTKVRVGIYETIPGYKITDIKFYDNQDTPGNSQYITLNSATASYFQGGTNVTGTVTYDWSIPKYTFAYSTGLASQKYWKGGQYTTGVTANSSTSAIDDLYGTETNKDANGYFIVMPTPSATDAVPLTLKCDYTLTSLDASGETIEVKGATATIPAEYTKWAINTAYTYLFKISDKTNGSTGSPTDPTGLFPITFDAVVVNFDDNTVGTETTISTPSITVYQEGDVVTNGITYKAGDVTVKVMDGTTDVTSTATLSYVELDGTTFDYTKDYEKLGTAGAATSWTSGALTSVSANKTYVIKAVNTTYTSYFVLIVGATETGPANS